MATSTAFCRPLIALGVIALGVTLLGGDAVHAQSVTYVEETGSRLVAAAGLGVNDPEEKDFALGDVDQDGDLDLVVGRKQPWMQTGRRRNVLFMNEGVAEGHAIDGVFVDRTLDYAIAADDGGSGFLDLTSDRDVRLIDVTGDGWLDVVTSTALSSGQPKTISHPRVYVNLGESGGAWLGFEYQEARTPTMPSAPHFCVMAFGDVTGNSALDLYFVDYETPLEDRLWINDGTGTFTDESVARMTYEMRESEFGTSTTIADMNGDGRNDIVKSRSNGAPYRVSIAYNDPLNPGQFVDFDVPYTAAPYYVEIDDLNNDGLADMVVQDDGTARYLLNTGNGFDGMADFQTFLFPSSTNGFGGKVTMADLNNDGFVDMIQSDVAVNGFGCARNLEMVRSAANPPNVTFIPDNGGIPLADRTGTWDVATVDLNDDGWLDLVIGRCTGISIWMAEPPGAMLFDYPSGRPESLVPDFPQPFEVTVIATGVVSLDPTAVTLHASVGGNAFLEYPLVETGADNFVGSFPAASCGERVEYYVTAATPSGFVYRDPPVDQYSTVAAASVDVALVANMEGDVSGWTIEGTPTVGGWEAAAPNGTLSSGIPAAPAGDASGQVGGMAFVTGNGAPGGAAGDSDLDGGPTVLTSPAFDLAGTDGWVQYDRWMFTSLGVADELTVSITANGVDWNTVEALGATGGAWLTHRFLVSDYVTPSSTLQVRFSVADQPNDSITEAGIDNFIVERIDCVPFLRGDCNGDGGFNLADAVQLLGFLFGDTDSVACEDACDAGDDEALDISDPIGMLAALFSGSGALPPPTPLCGFDPTGDETLGCGAYDACP